MNPYGMTGQERVAYCGQLMDSIRDMVYPTKPKTAAPWTPDRSARINQMAQTASVVGIKLRPGVLRSGSN